MSRTALFLIILLEGFTTIAVEILSIRQMIPFVGSNILNTSIIIGVFLLSLSIGYYKGGMIEGNYKKALLNNLLITFLFVSFGLSYNFLSYLYLYFEGLYGLVVFSVFIMSPIVYFLGQTIPILTNLIKHERNGKISGQLLFLSTFGSFLGSIITSAILMNFIGVSATVFVVIAVLAFLIFMLGWIDKDGFFKSVAYVVVLVPVAVVINTDFTFVKTNNYSSIDIVEENATRYMIINNSMSSSYDTKTGRSNFEYAKMVQPYIDSLSKEKRLNILVLGAGGFTLSLGDHKNRYTYVDIDDDLESISEKFLIKQKINGEFIADDGRHFLIKNRDKKEKYDIVLVDVFSNKTSIPPSFATKDFYGDVERSLSDDGVLIVNMIAKPLFRDPFSRKLKHTIEERFECHASPVSHDLLKFQNIVYACSKKKDSDIYTDNKINLFELAIK